MTPSSKSFYEYLTSLAAAYPHKKLLGYGDQWLNAGEVLTRAEKLAGKFQYVGVCPGDLIALSAERNLNTALAILALRLAGAVIVLVDPREDIQITLDSYDPPISVNAVVKGADDLFPVRYGQFSPVQYPSQEAAFILFTSGSTGKQKAVVLSEYNLINNLLDSEPLGDYAPNDIALGVLPLAHVFGLVLLAGTLVLGYSLFFPVSTDIPAILSAIEKEHITRMNGVPALYLKMAEENKSFDLHTLRAGFIGGGPVSGKQFAFIEEALGMTLIPVYGMSECVGISCASWKDSQAVRAGGVGAFYSMNTGKILLESGEEAPAGQEGEICVNGPSRMLGYYRQPMPAEELLHTGDLGWLDENGVLHICGRKKDIVIRNGNNLSCRIIEEALLSLPDIKEAAVVSLPDEQQGEIPAAMVVGKADLTVLKKLLRKNELPACIIPVGALPLTASGKPDKIKIRDELMKWRNG